MTYASGGLIQASDYNGFAGGSAGANVSGQINTVWGIGRGNAGYGQTAVANVSASTTVTAAQWASLINTVNGARKHQSGAGYSNISVPTAGTTISFISTLSSTLTAAYTNRIPVTTNSSSATSTKNITINVSAGVAGSGSVTWTVTFASVDQCRYFWNAGGYVYVYYNSFTNSGGTSRGTSIQTLAQTNYNYKVMLANSFNARVGTGGTVVTDTTTGGYYGQSTSPTERCRINSTSYYSGDYIYLNVNTNGTAGSYGANGNTITLTFGAYSASTGSTQPSDSINITLAMTCAINPPATTYIANTWGTPTVG
jgi:hypothetical protein